MAHMPKLKISVSQTIGCSLLRLSRVTLHKWLDDEYCPEETNVEISKVASKSYYESLVEKRTDLGEILLKMARDLESISYQESFHGAFSSANAAVNLIIQRIELQEVSGLKEVLEENELRQDILPREKLTNQLRHWLLCTCGWFAPANPS